jgi:hypothetical protein
MGDSVSTHAPQGISVDYFFFEGGVCYWGSSFSNFNQIFCICPQHSVSFSCPLVSFWVSFFRSSASASVLFVSISLCSCHYSQWLTAAFQRYPKVGLLLGYEYLNILCSGCVYCRVLKLIFIMAMLENTKFISRHLGFCTQGCKLCCRNAGLDFSGRYWVEPSFLCLGVFADLTFGVIVVTNIIFWWTFNIFKSRCSQFKYNLILFFTYFILYTYLTFWTLRRTFTRMRWWDEYCDL